MHLWHSSSVRRTLLLDRLGGAQADEPDEAEELTGCNPTARFSLQRSAQFRADSLGLKRCSAPRSISEIMYSASDTCR
jgi:hypothetical protein